MARIHYAGGKATHVSGAGLDTIARLEARGFIEPPTGDGFGGSDHRVTPAGEADRRRFSGS